MSGSKEVAVKGQSAVSAEFKNMFDQDLGYGAGEQIDNEDILIPKIHLAQALTPEVIDKKLEAGIYMDSISKEEIGDTVSVYVMSVNKLLQYYYLIRSKNKVKKEYIGTVAYTKDDYADVKENILPEELKQRLIAKGVNTDGLELEADKVLRFFVVRTEDVATASAFPYIVDFKRTSYNAGQELQTKFARMRTQGLPSYAKVFEISSKFVSEEHDYYVKKVSTGRDITAEELGQVEHWVRELRANADKYVADESDEVSEATVKDVGPETDESGKPKY